MRSLLQLKAQSNLHLFRAITSSEGPQRTLPPEIKLPRGNPCNLRNLWIKSVNFPTASIDLIKKLKMGKELIKLPLERLAFRSILLVGNKDI